MNINIVDVLITVVFLILLAAPGFIFAKLKLLPEKSAETISTIVLYCCQSVLVITSFQGKEYEAKVGLNMLWVALLVVFVHMVMFAFLSLVFAKKSADAKIRVLKFASIFGNCGFMGFPFLQSLFAGKPELLSELMIYGAVVISVFNLLTWTFGVYIMTGDKKQVSFKKIALNPVIISLIIGFLLFVIFKKPVVELADKESLGGKILTKLMQSLEYISAMVTPSSMIVIGIRLANVNIKQLFMDKAAYLCSFLKLVFMSLVSMLAVAFLPVDNTVQYTVFFLLSMPCSATTAMFAVKFKADGDFAAVSVLLSTTLSVVAIPLMTFIFMTVFGIPI